MRRNLAKIIFVTTLCVVIINLINPMIVYGKIPTNVTIKNKYANTFVVPANSILGVLKVVGIIFAVAMIMIIGIKYMLSSAQEKAEQKVHFIFYLIGAILVGSAPQVIKIMYDFIKSI